MESDSESPGSVQGQARRSAASSAPPKRGAKACTACRKGKNRCVNTDGQAPCRRCQQSGAVCIFEQTHDKSYDEGRMDRLERSVGGLTSTIEGLLTVIQATGMVGGTPRLPPPPLPPQQPHPAYPPPTYPNGLPPGYGHHLESMPHAGPSSARPNPLAAYPTGTHSPSNTLHWDASYPTNGNLGQIIADSRGLYPSNPLPPVMPNFGRATSNPTATGAAAGYGSQSPADPVLQANGAGQRAKRPRLSVDEGSADSRTGKPHPPLPNYRAPPHPISQYGLVQSNVPSDDEDALPSSSLTAPFEALAEAAAAAASGATTPVIGRNPRRRTRRAIPPPNAFPDVIEKGLVDETLARQIMTFYFTHLHKFFPILDPSKVDSFESMRERTPWSVDAVICAAAARMPNPSSEVQDAAEHAAEETHGIARSSLFGPTVRWEAVSAMALAAVWSENTYCASGHAMRMGFELGLHRALGKLQQSNGKVRPPNEEQELVVAARVFLCLLWLDWTVSSGSGRPHLYNSELVSPDKLENLLQHPLSVGADTLLVAYVELIACRTQIEQTFLDPARTGDVIELVRTSTRGLQTWWKTWDGKMAAKFVDDSFERKSLLAAYHAASTILATTAIKGQTMDPPSAEARELAMSARQSASDVLDLWLNSPALSGELKFANQAIFVDITFSALLLLKLARLFPEGSGSLSQVAGQCHQVQTLLRDIPQAERYHATCRIALDRFSKAFSVDLPPKDAWSDHLMTDFTLAAASSSLQNYQGLQAGGLAPSASFGGGHHAGTGAVPDWLSDPLAWTFDMDMSQGLDRLFLPGWSMDALHGGQDW